jgi:hypothetical protein
MTYGECHRSSFIRVNDLSNRSNSRTHPRMVPRKRIPAFYPHRRSGGGGSRYGLSFGDSRTYAVAQMTAFEADGKTTIHSQMLGVLDPMSDDADEVSDEDVLPASMESMDSFWALFTSEIESRGAPYRASTRNPRMRNRYTFNRNGSGGSSAGIRDQSWQWKVPEEVLNPPNSRSQRGKGVALPTRRLFTRGQFQHPRIIAGLLGRKIHMQSIGFGFPLQASGMAE